MALDLGALLADALENGPDSGTGREQIEYIDLSLIDSDPNNFYEITGIDNLAANIATCGLQQPIRVRRHPENHNRYIIVSGHRRRAALELLMEDAPEKWSEAPCIVERDDITPELQQLRLIYANANTRQLTSAETMEQAAQVERLLYELKEKGFEFPGRMRDHVAAAVGKSKSKLGRLSVIRQHLISEFMAVFVRNEIGESVAYELAQMPSEWQRLMYEGKQKSMQTLYATCVTHARERYEAMASTKCKVNPALRCMDNKPRLLKIARMNQYSYGCDKCCCDCLELDTCKHACKAAYGVKRERRDAKAKAEAAAKEREAQRVAAIREFANTTYARVKMARDACKMSLADYLSAVHFPSSRSYADSFNAIELGYDANVDGYTSMPFACGEHARGFMKLCHAADVLGCSTDFLLGRDAPAPESHTAWQTGNPDAVGDYVVAFRWTEDSRLSYERMTWGGCYWDYLGDQFPEDGEIIEGWVPVFGEEE